MEGKTGARNYNHQGRRNGILEIYQQVQGGGQGGINGDMWQSMSEDMRFLNV